MHRSGLVLRRLSVSAEIPAAVVLRAVGQEIRRYFDEYRDMLGVTHRVQIRVCKRITSPMMLGLIDPILVIPEGRYTAKELEYIFRHELSHLKRHDVWAKSLMLLVRIVQLDQSSGSSDVSGDERRY